MWSFGEGVGWWSPSGGLSMLIFIGGVIALMVWGILKINRRNSSTVKYTTLDVAEERYAKGEISKEEFEQIKKDLS